jgi:hypothetical protein
VNATLSEPSPGVIDEIVGADGGPDGVNSWDSDEYEPHPIEFCALTLNL